MEIRKRKVDTLDILIALLLAISIFAGLYILLGFAKYGIQTPLEYYGGDDFTEYVTVKRSGENGWFWSSDDLGAPYSSDWFDFSAYFLRNSEVLIAKIIYYFANDAFITVNLQYLLTFAMCGVSAFFVLRELRYKRIIAFFGAVLFALAPYIFARGISHYCLSACYFVPLSILLCVWAIQEDEDYLALKADFFKNKRNLLAILFSLFIANNGIGYYPIFTCFFLLVAAAYKIGKTGKFRSACKAIVNIVIIFCFFVFALLPMFAYRAINGYASEAVVRGSANAELYGLKIIQLFMPLNGHGITFLENLIQKYNAEMPLVNENMTAYLGFGACVGFLISLCYLFKHNKDNGEKEQRLQLFSRLNICAVLFATIGGFSAVIFFAYPFLRGYNRISIFIMFISICALCEVMQSIWNRETRSKRKVAYIALFVMLIGVCMFDQLPRYGGNDGILEANQSAYNSDHTFVQAIESQLQEDDMVFQLPYHATPERGPVNNMNDYQLYTGYLHSTSLKWSYGGMAGSESDLWNQYVASLPLKLMVEALVSSGFRGIYIDARAYETEDLQMLVCDIQTLLDVEPSVSDNGNLVFFNLYPYIEQNKELLEKEPIVIKKIPGSNLPIYNLFPDETIYFCGAERNADVYVSEGLSGNEETFAWSDGKIMKIAFLLSDYVPENSYVMLLDYIGTFNGEQTVKVYENDVTVFEDTLFGAGTMSFEIQPNEDGIVQLTFEFPNAVSPQELGMSADTRELAIQIQKGVVTICDVGVFR